MFSEFSPTRMVPGSPGRPQPSACSSGLRGRCTRRNLWRRSSGSTMTNTPVAPAAVDGRPCPDVDDLHDRISAAAVAPSVPGLGWPALCHPRRASKRPGRTRTDEDDAFEPCRRLGSMDRRRLVFMVACTTAAQTPRACGLSARGHRRRPAQVPPTGSALDGLGDRHEQRVQ